MKLTSGLLALLVISLGIQAQARLGEKVVVPPKAPSALQSKAMAALFSVRESSPNGVLVKEYISNDGVVFAVSWRGVAEPNLADLLGDYFPEYDQAAEHQLPVQRRGRTAQITASQIVVNKFGHMRDIRGLAYVPSLVPEGVNVGELQ